MKITILALLFSVTLSQAYAQGSDPAVQDIQVPPANLNELGTMMGDRVIDMFFGNEGVSPSMAIDGITLDLFGGSQDEDPNLSEIKMLAREIENQRSIILQLVALQESLIDFARQDPVAAFKSRIPVSVCAYGIDQRFCERMTSSFQ